MLETILPVILKSVIPGLAIVSESNSMPLIRYSGKEPYANHFGFQELSFESNRDVSSPGLGGDISPTLNKIARSSGCGVNAIPSAALYKA